MTAPQTWPLPPPGASFPAMTAAPAYTAVTARHTLHRPAPPPEPAKPTKVSWSPAVRQYVQRAFEQDNAIPGIDTAAMQEKLRVVITQAAESGQIEGMDWSTYPLPQHLIKQDRDQAALTGAQNAILANVHAPVPPTPGNKKRKPSDTTMTDADQDVTPPWKKKLGNGGLEDLSLIHI